LVVSLKAHRRAGVVSAELASGLMVHARAMKAQPQVRISALVTGLELVEPPDLRGISGLVGAGLSDPSGRWTALAVPEGLMLRATVEPPATIASTLRELAALLTMPAIDAQRFGQARDERFRQLKSASADHQVAAAMLELLAPGVDGALAPPGPDHVASLTHDMGVAFASEQFARRPIDIAIVGPLDAHEALREAIGALAAVGPRPRDALWPVRGVGRAAGKDVTITGRLPAGQVMLSVGVPAPGIRELRASRVAQVCAVLLENALGRAARSAQADALLVIASPVPGRVYPKLGLCVGTMLVRADAAGAQAKGQGLVASVHQQLAALAQRGPARAELEEARQRVARDAAKRLDESEHWLRALPSAWFLDVPVDELADAPSVVLSLGFDEVAQQLAQWSAPGAITTVLVLPQGPPAVPAPPEPPAGRAPAGGP
jgi:hypothetical protein